MPDPDGLSVADRVDRPDAGGHDRRDDARQCAHGGGRDEADDGGHHGEGRGRGHRDVQEGAQWRDTHSHDRDPDADDAGDHGGHHRFQHDGEEDASARRPEGAPHPDLVDALTHGHQRDVDQAQGP